MNLQIFDVDALPTFHVDETGLHDCNQKYCSAGHLYSLYKDGIWLGHDPEDMAKATSGEWYIIHKQ